MVDTDDVVWAIGEDAAALATIDAFDGVLLTVLLGLLETTAEGDGTVGTGVPLPVDGVAFDGMEPVNDESARAIGLALETAALPLFGVLLAAEADQLISRPPSPNDPNCKLSASPPAGSLPTTAAEATATAVALSSKGVRGG